MPTPDEKLAALLDTIAAAARRSGRDPGAVRLCAVSKTFPAEAVQALADSGQRLFGESRVQEAAAKIPALPAHLEWHLIGHLQKNKIRKALPLFAAIHSVDSLGTAEQIDRVAAEEGRFPRVFLEVNLAAESSKYGFPPDALRAQFEALLALGRLEIAGLMAIPPAAASAEASRPHFARLRELRDTLQEEFGVPLPELSMGMSGDYEIAVEEGSTIVRVGSALFGER
ncbi:MAG: YggS family pyridoxal phosphate-dependent enzyme [Verrucomicrobiales bacterium]